MANGDVRSWSANRSMELMSAIEPEQRPRVFPTLWIFDLSHRPLKMRVRFGRSSWRDTPVMRSISTTSSGSTRDLPFTQSETVSSGRPIARAMAACPPTPPQAGELLTQGGAAQWSSQRFGRAGVFEASGDAQESGRPLSVLRSTEWPRALQPASQEFRRRHFLQRLEHGFRLVDLSDTDETQHHVGVRLDHLWPLSERTRPPIDAVSIPLCDETQVRQQLMGHIAAGVAWI